MTEVPQKKKSHSTAWRINLLPRAERDQVQEQGLPVLREA
jgi:hypothetical protein